MSTPQFLVLCALLCAIASEVCETNGAPVVQKRAASWAIVATVLLVLAGVWAWL